MPRTKGTLENSRDRSIEFSDSTLLGSLWTFCSYPRNLAGVGQVACFDMVFLRSLRMVARSKNAPRNETMVDTMTCVRILQVNYQKPGLLGCNMDFVHPQDTNLAKFL